MKTKQKKWVGIRDLDLFLFCNNDESEDPESLLARTAQLLKNGNTAV